MEITHTYRRDVLRTVRVALTLLQNDTQMIEDGYEFFDVVDFAAIYAYVYKQSGPPFISLEGEPEEKTFARCQMALKMLFTVYPRPLLLIPPYSAELRNHLLSLKIKVGMAVLDAGALYKEKLSRLIASSEEFKHFVGARSEQPSQEVDEKVFQSALKVGKEFFPELYAALAFLLTGGTDTFKTLLTNGTLRDADEALPECKEVPYHSPQTDDWYKNINMQRNGQRSVQSYTDAMACRYVEFANARLNAEKKVVVFVSPSARVKDAVEEGDLVLCNGVKVSAVRDLTYCLLAAVHKNDRTMIADSLLMVSRLLDLYESPIPIEWQGLPKREEAASLWKSCENLLLMSASTFSEISPQKASTKREADFLDLLRQLHLAGTTGKEEVAKQLEQDLSSLHDMVTELRTMVPDKPVNVPSKEYFRITFPGLPDELSIELHIVDKGVVRLARSLERQVKANFTAESVSSLKNLIHRMANEPEAIAELHLLAGYILAREKKYEEALKELEAGRDVARGEQLAEIFFVSAAIHRKMYQGDRACDLLLQGIDLTPDDPRIRVELAKALWVQWLNGSRQANSDGVLAKALEHLRVAEQSTVGVKSKELQAQIENVSAYLHTERALIDAGSGKACLDQARMHLKRLEETLPEAQWPGRFFDTRGYWYYAKAREAMEDSTSKKILLEAAKRDFERALQTSEDSPDELRMRQEHQRLVIVETLERGEAATR